MGSNNPTAPFYAASLIQTLNANSRRENDPPTQTSQFGSRQSQHYSQVPTTSQPATDQAERYHPIETCADGAMDAFRQIAATLTIKPNNNPTSLAGVLGSALLKERAILQQLDQPGQISANGSCRLLCTQSGWITLNLARDEDWALMPAWLQGPVKNDHWPDIISLVKKQCGQQLIQRAQLMGLPASLCNPDPADITPVTNWFNLSLQADDRQPRKINNPPKVLDLSSLWAGPLCSSLLQKAGCEVVKVESEHRPDASRIGSRKFFDLLNARKSSVRLDFKTDSGINQLKQLMLQSDIVIEGSRPRALRQLGIDAESIINKKPGLIWLSISAYGRSEPDANYVGFGDDVAVGAGAFAMTPAGPNFIGDALSDPLTGIHAALAGLYFWHKKRSCLIDISLAGVTRWVMQTISQSNKIIPPLTDLQAGNFSPVILQHANQLGVDTKQYCQQHNAVGTQCC
ncbi:MAG: CoA transferase [Pseudomonadales bacterium]|nr:CoA transferase [Pseudomonadales bacterium]